MYIVKWVETDEVFNYYPCIKIFSDYDEAREYKAEKEAELEQQNEKLDSIFEGKIISEIHIDVIESKTMQIKLDKLLFCTKCNEQANKIVVVVETEMELHWNETDKVYEIGEYYHNYEQTKSVVCAKCINDLIDKK